MVEFSDTGACEAVWFDDIKAKPGELFRCSNTGYRYKGIWQLLSIAEVIPAPSKHGGKPHKWSLTFCKVFHDNMTAINGKATEKWDMWIPVSKVELSDKLDRKQKLVDKARKHLEVL